MQLIAIVILGALLGFVYGANTDGFIFSSKICLFAGITLIMPSLFNFELSHVRLIWTHRVVLLKGFVVNYVLLPVLALAIGLATGDFGIAAGLFALALLSGGGMVMHWIKRSKADTSLGFLLLFVNLLAITLSLYMLDLFGTYAAGYFEMRYDSSVAVARFAKGVIVLLVLVPLIVSRIVRHIKPLVQFIKTYQKYISHISIFGILFYLFGLQGAQRLVDIWDFDPQLLPISFIAVVVFYGLTYYFSTRIYDLDSPQERAAFWHSVTRYITLALVIATFSINDFGVSMLLPIMFSYIVQIPLAVYIDSKLEKQINK